MNKKQNTKVTNIFLVTNLYSFFSSKDSFDSTQELMKATKNNIFIYDYFESEYKPTKKIFKIISSSIYIKKFLVNNNFFDFIAIIRIIFRIIFTRKKMNLYIDSCKTLFQLILVFIFKLKKYNIYGVCFTFPYAFQRINLNNEN
mgnify:CR=1 FL=1|tara:strand:+ start:20306 stop:20737 length:432 start_codon:yes stop_codon:yes gene_type:complete